jgi:hypothetical protein
MIPDIFRPYLDHPLVESKLDQLDVLDSPLLNSIIRAEDLMIRGIRDFYLNPDPSKTSRLSPGQFSSSILLARGLAFLDIAHYKSNVADISKDVWNVTPTTAKKQSFNSNMMSSIIPRLYTAGIVVFDPSIQTVMDRMPYPVGSKLFVQKNLIEIPRLFQEQSNHYSILGGVQDFPELKYVLEETAPNQPNFNRDYNALQEIDNIREQEIRNRLYTFSTSFLAGTKSEAIWLSLLSDASDNYRTALKDLMDLQGELGGFISYQEIVSSTGKKAREVAWIMRNVNDLGIAKMVRTLDLENALSRITSGTLLGMNYRELNNAQSILVLTRQVPESMDMLNILQTKQELNEGDLIDKYMDARPVYKTLNSLKDIGLIKQRGVIDDGIYELTPCKDNVKFISDVLAVAARSRHVTEPDYDLINILEEQYKGIDEASWRRGTEQLRLDYFKEAEIEIKK